jgi:hypothetical protein
MLLYGLHPFNRKGKIRVYGEIKSFSIGSREKHSDSIGIDVLVNMKPLIFFFC